MNNENTEAMYPVQKKKKKKLPIIIGIIAVIIVAIFAISSMSEGDLSESEKEVYIDMVRTGYPQAYGDSVSYDEVLKYEFTDGDWYCFIAGEDEEVAGQVVVEYRGNYTEGGETSEAFIQFVIDKDNEEFETYYFGWDGESKDPNDVIEILFDDYLENHM